MEGRWEGTLVKSKKHDYYYYYYYYYPHTSSVTHWVPID